MAQKINNNWFKKLKEHLRKTSQPTGEILKTKDKDDSELALKVALRQEMSKQLREQRARTLPLVYLMVI